MALSVGALQSNYDEVLKTFYLPAIREQLNHSTILADIIEVDEENVSGKNASIEMHYGRNRGIGARADGGALPDAGYQAFKIATVPTKYMYGRITVTGPTIAATRDERGAYARALDAEIRGMVKDFRKEVNRQLWGCGYGVLARWRTTTDGDTYTLQRKYRGNSAGGDGFGSTFGGKYLEEMLTAVPVVLSSASSSSSMSYTVDTTDIYKDGATVADSSDGTYTTIDGVTDPSVTEAAGTFYIRPAALAAAANNGENRLEMMGLRGIVTNEDIDSIVGFDGTNSGPPTTTANFGFPAGSSYNDPLQGLSVDSYTWFKANVDTHSSGRYMGQRSLTFTLMQKMFDRVEEKAGKDYGPDLILTTRAIRREYLELCRADRRNVNTMTLDGGWVALDYNGVPFTVDDDAIDGEIYFLTTKDLKVFRMSDYDWMSKDGSILHRVSGYDAYEATLFRYAELGCFRRNSHGVLCDLDYIL